MKKKVFDLVVKGEIDFNGMTIKHIEGGFYENSKIITTQDVATIHEIEVKRVNELIFTNLDEFDEGIDIIDMMNNKNLEVTATDLGLITSNGQKHCYILSEQGYLALAMLMKTPKAKQIRKQFRREYFRLKEENQKLRKYNRGNNRYTTKCLLNLDGKHKEDTDFIHLVNNTVRNEVERLIEQVGVKAGVIAVNANLSENTISNWRCRRTTLSLEDLESIVNVISKFKEFMD